MADMLLLLWCSQREHVYESVLSDDAPSKWQAGRPVPHPVLFRPAVRQQQEEEPSQGSPVKAAGSPAAEGQADGDKSLGVRLS